MNASSNSSPIPSIPPAPQVDQPTNRLRWFEAHRGQPGAPDRPFPDGTTLPAVGREMMRILRDQIVVSEDPAPRNHNPGALRYRNSNRARAIGATGIQFCSLPGCSRGIGYAQFDDPQQGYRAYQNQVERWIRSGLSYTQIINTHKAQGESAANFIRQYTILLRNRGMSSDRIRNEMSRRLTTADVGLVTEAMVAAESGFSASTGRWRSRFGPPTIYNRGDPNNPAWVQRLFGETPTNASNQGAPSWIRK